MFHKRDDGTYVFTRRFWVTATIGVILICAIGFSTQRTANRVEAQARETAEYAQSTNDCLNQVIGTLKERTGFTAALDDLNTRERKALADLLVGLAAIPTDQPQTMRDAQAKPYLTAYFSKVNQVAGDRQDLLDKRAAKPYPDPSCGFEVPGRR